MNSATQLSEDVKTWSGILKGLPTAALTTEDLCHD